jgi:acetyl-CoA carboxylase biotin carboxyl carrier protein
MKLTLEQVYELMDKLSASGLGEVEIESEEVKVKIKAKEPQPLVQAPPAASGTVTAVAAENLVVPAREPAGKIVKSPIVGTFYEASGPDKEPFVRVGDTVKKGDILFIIESMKLMNEVASDFDGRVAEFFVENGSPVEFGQPILRLE